MRRLISVFMLTFSLTAAAERPAHHLPDGTFRNNYIDSIDKPFADLMRWRREQPEVEPIAFELAKNDPAALVANRSESTLTWVGHSTFLIQWCGRNILTDPHFSQRASPVSFAGPKRTTPPGLAIDELPPIDIVIISHNHYDHLDRGTIRKLAKLRNQQGEPTLFLVPLRLAKWMRGAGVERVIELDWWQHEDDGDLRIHAVPVQHWSARSLTDRNRTLWAGWVFEIGDDRIFFAGDTGYSRGFLDIRERIGAMRLSLIPVGAYLPRWFMAPGHVNPEEAVKIHLDVESEQSIGMHWGTFILTDEPMDEPPQKLIEALDRAGIDRDAFTVMRHGETRPLAF